MELREFRDNLQNHEYDEAEMFIEDEKMNLVPIRDEYHIHYIKDLVTGRLRVVISAIPKA